MILTTDFHTHILPLVDDGSQSLDESVAMFLQEQTDNVDNIVLTPHFYPQKSYPASFVADRQRAFEQLLSALPENVQRPNFILGAEVLFCPGMSQWEQLDSLTLGQSQYILIEMPFGNWSESTYQELLRIHNDRGLTPILAHIERYMPAIFAGRFINRLNKLPILLQINCDFLTDVRTQRLALKLIREQMVHLIGSDCHSSTWRRPVMAQAREVLMNNIDHQTRLFLQKNEKLVTQR